MVVFTDFCAQTVVGKRGRRMNCAVCKRELQIEVDVFRMKVHPECHDVLREFVEKHKDQEFSWDDVIYWWWDYYCYECKHHYLPCEKCKGEEHCPARFSDGTCRGSDTCNLMTRRLWCDKFEHRKEG